MNLGKAAPQDGESGSIFHRAENTPTHSIACRPWWFLENLRNRNKVPSNSADEAFGCDCIATGRAIVPVAGNTWPSMSLGTATRHWKSEYVAKNLARRCGKAPLLSLEGRANPNRPKGLDEPAAKNRELSNVCSLFHFRECEATKMHVSEVIAAGSCGALTRQQISSEFL